MRAFLTSLGATITAVTLVAGAAPVSAQELGSLPMPIVEVSGGYVFMRDLSDDLPGKMNFPAGWYAAAAVNLNRWFGIVGEGTGSGSSPCFRIP